MLIHDAAIRCNNDIQLLQLLAAPDVEFDCMSLTEISQALYLGVDPGRLLFTSPCKDPDEVHHARLSGVHRAVFDTEDELRKLAHSHPDAALYLQLWADDPSSRVRSRKPFGASVEYGRYLLALSSTLSVKVQGFYLNVGHAVSDPTAYTRAVACARIAYDNARRQGHSITSIYIGGGFTVGDFQQAAVRLREAIDDTFGSLKSTIRWTAEPGPFWVRDAYYLATRVLGTRDDGESFDVFINDGIHRNFFHAVVDSPVSKPMLLNANGAVDANYPSTSPEASTRAWTVWGQTCRPYDRIVVDCRFPRRPRINDWLVFSDMGSTSMPLHRRSSLLWY